MKHRFSILAFVILICSPVIWNPDVDAQVKQTTIFMLPKFVGIRYFDATQKGAVEAAGELGIKLIHKGASTANLPEQIKLIESAIESRVDVISISALDPAGVAPALQKARDAGIKIVTWDADANVRDMLVNQATFRSVGETLVESMVDQIGRRADVAIVTTSLTAPNQSTWVAVIRELVRTKYPGLRLLEMRAPGENQQDAQVKTLDLLRRRPSIKGLWVLGGVPSPGVAEAVQLSGNTGKIAVVPLATPQTMAAYIKDGTVRDVVLWNPVDLGYLSVYAAKAVLEGKSAPGAKFKAGRLGAYTVQRDQIGQTVVLGPPKVFNAANVDQFNF
jgi:rhamnose transport system substrate-binding protein